VGSNYWSISQRRKKLTIPWQCDLSILIYEHGSQRSPSLSTSMDQRFPFVSTSMDQRPPSLSTSMDQRSPSLSTSMGHGSPFLSTSMGIKDVYEHGSQRSPSLSTSMENDLSYPSVFFPKEKIDPSESIFLKRS
jgi:hypothetical protein